MSTVVSTSPPPVRRGGWSIELSGEASDFGLIGLRRETLRILKPEFVNELALQLALRGTREEITSGELTARLLTRYPDWQQEYQIVHLIEKSLWIQGQSDLVMTLTKNPSQIPDRPPQKVLTALSKAHLEHPDANVWYGVPLFSDQVNADGLPVPLTAAEVRAEHRRRLEGAQQHAARYRLLYRAMAFLLSLPLLMLRGARALLMRLRGRWQRIVNYYRRYRRDVRRRQSAAVVAELAYCRYGHANHEIPEHTTLLGQVTEQGWSAALRLQGLTSQIGGVVPMTPGTGHLIVLGNMMPLAPLFMFMEFSPFFVPAMIISADPFLFVELADEPEKLRHVAHWYWQGSHHTGKQKLHLHL